MPTDKAGEDARAAGLSSMDSSRWRTSGPLMNSGSYAKQKSPVVNDPVITKDSMFMGQWGGSSSRRVAVSSSRDAFAGSEANPQRSRTTDASPGALHKISSQQRSPVESADAKRTMSGRNTSHVKDYETALKGIEGLQFESD
ncbi:casein kinase 1-like protein 2 [Herrania umbratica]|uniref:Casein kinase 1-like protein 2 n=1 Tax=Herrania umbratica TaxID=108875 RepID=A0A6J1ABD8_9ROSI|nr:casein kinase 1-like protein 2 [Herrania umbratica]